MFYAYIYVLNHPKMFWPSISTHLSIPSTTDGKYWSLVSHFASWGCHCGDQGDRDSGGSYQRETTNQEKKKQSSNSSNNNNNKMEKVS